LFRFREGAENRGSFNLTLGGERGGKKGRGCRLGVPAFVARGGKEKGEKKKGQLTWDFGEEETLRSPFGPGGEGTGLRPSNLRRKKKKAISPRWKKVLTR